MDEKQRVNPDAVARVEMAKEKARISGKKPQRATRLERAAEEWEIEREAEKRRSEERARIHREAEIPMISLSQVPLEAMAKGEKEDAEVVWKLYQPPEDGKRKPVRLNGAAITALALRLKAVEWARAMGEGKRQDSRAQRLEQEARLWQQRRKLW